MFDEQPIKASPPSDRFANALQSRAVDSQLHAHAGSRNGSDDETDTPRQPTVAAPQSRNPNARNDLRVVTMPRESDPQRGQRPANPRRCRLCEVRA